jgi:hypothetical protein
VNIVDMRDLGFLRGDYCLLVCDAMWSGRNLTAEDSTAAI